MGEPGDEILGWATDRLVKLDTLAPGLIRRVVTASPMVRQAIFLVLACLDSLKLRPHTPVQSDGNEDEMLARVLRAERAREIFIHAFGRAPEGLLGALERLGGTPMKSAKSYHQLAMIFADPDKSRTANALRYVGAITEKTLDVVEALDDRWIHQETLKRLENADEAGDFNGAVRFAQSTNSRATNEVIEAAIAHLKPEATLAKMVQRWVRRADRFPEQPVEQDNDLYPLATVRDLIHAGRRYRNCLNSRLEQILLGMAAFAEFHGEAIIEFRPLSNGVGWILWEVHALGNGIVPEPVAQAARQKCAELGIPHVERRQDTGDWRRYRQFIGGEDWPFLWAA
jgi:hypothetical protein